jgi:MFS family permease
MHDFINRWPITPLQKGIMSESWLKILYQLDHSQIMNIAAVLELGALMGALVAGVYADRYSRRHSIVVACSTLLHSHGDVNQPNGFFQSYFVLGQLFNAAPCILATYLSVVPWVE